MNDGAHNKTSPVLATAQFGSAGNLCKQRGTIDYICSSTRLARYRPVGTTLPLLSLLDRVYGKKSIARHRTFSLRAMQVDMQGDNSPA